MNELLSTLSTIAFGLNAVIDHKKLGRDTVDFQVKYFGMEETEAGGYVKGSQYGFLGVGTFILLSEILTLLGVISEKEGTPPSGIFEYLFNLFYISFISFCLLKIFQSIKSKISQ